MYAEKSTNEHSDLFNYLFLSKLHLKKAIGKKLCKFRDFNFCAWFYAFNFFRSSSESWHQ